MVWEFDRAGPTSLGDRTLVFTAALQRIDTRRIGLVEARRQLAITKRIRQGRMRWLTVPERQMLDPSVTVEAMRRPCQREVLKLICRTSIDFRARPTARW